MKILSVLVMGLAACAAVAEPVTNAPVIATATNATAVTNVSAVTTGPIPVVTAVAGVTNPPVAAASAPDPQVGKVLLALAGRLQSAKRFRCEVSFQVNSESEGMRQELFASYSLAAERPNRLALRQLKGMPGTSVMCNGKTLTTYAPQPRNRYEEHAAPASLEALSQGVGPMAGNMLFVDNLLRDDVYAAIMDGVGSVTYAGQETLDGQLCDHLKFVQDQFDWELWVSTGANPVVVRVVTDMSKGFTGMTGEETGTRPARMTVVNRFSKWAVEGDLPADTFEFKPPAGARKTASLFMGEDEEPVDANAPNLPGDEGTTNGIGKDKE